MKKIFTFFASLLVAISVFALDTNGNYGFKKQDTPDGYQQYVGQQIMVRDAFGKLETWEKSGFKPSDETKGKAFTITKVEVKDVELNGEPNKEIKIEAVETGGKKKIKFKGYESVAVKVGFWGDIKQWPLIGYMPIVLVEPFNEFKSKTVGTTIKHPMVKDQYEIIDVFVGLPHDASNAATAEPRIKVKNLRTGETQFCTYARRDKDPFADALKGSYKTALARVEKPEDSSNRYSETKTVTDAGVEKYSFNDSTINIVIFGTPEQFNFELKNVSPNSLKIIWNEAAFVGLDGNTSKIMHSGVKYSQREGDQPATTVIRGAKIDDLACPTANVYYDEGVTIGYSTIGNGWKTRSMLPKEYVGKEAGEIRLMLPIQVKDVINEYTFVFKVYYTYDKPELLNQENL